MIIMSVLCSKPIEWETPGGEKAQVNLQLQFSAFFGYGQVDAEPGYLGLQCHGILWPVVDSDLPHYWPIAPPVISGKVRAACTQKPALLWLCPSGMDSRPNRGQLIPSATCALQVMFVLCCTAEALHWSESRGCFLQRVPCMQPELPSSSRSSAGGSQSC